jgi:hypothetical protein
MGFGVVLALVLHFEEVEGGPSARGGLMRGRVRWYQVVIPGRGGLLHLVML